VNVKFHYSGLAISYNSKGGGIKSLSPSTVLPNSFSRINRQKRQVHDMVEWIRKNATYRPLIGVITVPIPSDNKLNNENLSKFFKNLRKTYDCKNYVWVREYQGGGRPHYHFVADSRFLDAVDISRYWSSLFGCDNLNSVRLGTDPKQPPRKFFVDSPRMSRYLTKYLGAGSVKVDGEKKRIVRVNNEERNLKIKNFGNSQEVGLKSQPVTYNCEYIYQKKVVPSPIFSDYFQACDLKTKKIVVIDSKGVRLNSPSIVKSVTNNLIESVENIERKFTLCEDSEKNLIQIYGAVPDHLKEFNDHEFSWINPNPIHKVYYGIPKKGR